MVSPQRGLLLCDGYLEGHAQTHGELRSAVGFRTDAKGAASPGNPIQSDGRESVSWRSAGRNRIRGLRSRALQLYFREVLSLDDSASSRHQLSTDAEDRNPCWDGPLLRPAALYE